MTAFRPHRGGAGCETTLITADVTGFGFLEPDLGPSHLRLQQYAHLIYLTIFTKSELGFGDGICAEFEVIQLSPCFRVEPAHEDEKVFAAYVQECHGDGVLFILEYAVEEFLRLRGCVEGVGAVGCEGEGRIAIVCVGLFMCQ